MHTDKSDLGGFLARLEAVTREAGEIALSYFRHGERTSAAVSYKGGGSPVTEADIAVDRFLHDEMRRLAPQAGWLSEETADSAARLALDQIIIVDPIDGTHAFSRGDARWAVSIALVAGGRPVAGVIHAPALGETYTGAAGFGAWLNGESLGKLTRNRLAGAIVVAPRMLHSEFARLPQNFVLAPRTPSLALRLVDVAAGRRDLVVAAPNSRDWDIAAADVILEEAGATLGENEGAPLVYNRPSLARDMLIAAPNSLYDEARAVVRAVAEGASHA